MFICFLKEKQQKQYSVLKLTRLKPWTTYRYVQRWTVFTKYFLSFHLICPVSSEECYEKFMNIMVNYKYIHTRGYNYCGSIPLFWDPKLFSWKGVGRVMGASSKICSVRIKDKNIWHGTRAKSWFSFFVFVTWRV